MPKLTRRLFLVAIVILVGAGAAMFYMIRVKHLTPDFLFHALPFDPDDRILILAPHPDDEVLGCGGVIQKALDLNIPVKIVFLTYGDNNQWSFLVYRKHPVITPKAVLSMGLIRHAEAIRADKVLGLSPEQLTFLGYPDFRTLNIWDSHWGDRPPERGMLTDVKAVPYASAYRPGAPYKGEEILQDLKSVIRTFKPTKIFLSHPADYHPDHRALYLFTRIALWDLADEMNPEIYPYLIHYPRWPQPKGYDPSLSLTPPAVFQDSIHWFSHNLTANEVEVKHQAIRQHQSQYDASKKYLLSFMRSNEPFGRFKPITLTSHLPPLELISRMEKHPIAPPEELIAKERALFVGIEKHSTALSDDSLVITTTLSRPLGKEVGIVMHIFGYRSDKDFTYMPKINIKLGAIKHRIFDQDIPLQNDVIDVIRKPKKIIVRVPLKVLGNPERILTSARTYAGEIPLNRDAWRIIKLSRSN